LNRQRFVVLDRDGTIIFERHYLSHPDQVQLLPNAAAGLRRMLQLGMGLVVITNQSALGRGIIDTERLDLIHRRLLDLLAAEQIDLKGIYFCPHLPTDDCQCRKPKPGLLERAAQELEFEPDKSFVIGDKQCDIELGSQLAATTFLVKTGYGTQTAADLSVRPSYVVNDLLDAAGVMDRLSNCDRR